MVLENFIVDAPIVWDRVGKKIFENPHVKQGRKMRVQITNAGMVEDLSGYTLALGWKHTVSGVDGLDVFEDSSEANVGIFEMAYTENLMTNLGNLKASLVLTSVEDMVVAESNDFYVKVDDSPFGADAEQGVGSFTRLAEILLNEESRIAAEVARVSAEETRVTDFNALVDSEIIAQNVATKLQAKEAEYLPRLVSNEQQLADKAEKTDLEVEKARIDAFTTLAAGSTTGDAELIDGRVGSDGITYANVGGAIRGQVIGLRSDLTDFKADVSILNTSENLLNLADANFKLNNFVAPTTGLDHTSASYNSTGFIKVTPGKKIIKTHGPVRTKGYMRFIAAFDSSLTIMSGSGSSVDTQNFIVPSGVAWVKISYTNRTDFTDPAIFEVEVADESIPAYTAYFEPYYSTKVSTDATLLLENEAADAKAVGDALATINGNIVPYKNPSGRAAATSLDANVAIAIPTFPEMLKTGQSFSYSAKFDSFGVGDTVSIGFMNPAYASYQSWMEISYDRVRWLLSGTTAISNDLHGLTLSDYINVTVEISTYTAQFKVTITTVGGTFTFTQISDSTRFNAIGTLTAKSTIATADVVLSGSCTQFKYHTWLIGDSYFGSGASRIGGRLMGWGHSDGVLLDGLGGLNSQQAYGELQKLLTYGTPKTLVWYLGMNDNATTVASHFPLVEALCDANGIELIFNKIPFVPSRLVENAAVNNYVLASGRRYVDSYAAVGADSSGVWYPGHLDPDGVHPTALGAAALTSRLIADVPEILSLSN